MKDVWKFTKMFLMFFSLALLLEIVMRALESKYLINFLTSNILSILLAFLAINTATLGVIASKVQEIIARFGNVTFNSTINEMYFSLKEQVWLLFFSLVFLILQDSKIIDFQYKDLILNSSLTCIFFYSVYILWDTGKAVFVITNLTNNMPNSNNNNTSL